MSRNLLPRDDFLGLPEGLNVTTTLGLIFFQKPNGECYWYDRGNFPESQVDWYVNEFTADWNIARGFAALGAMLGFLVFLYSLSLTCSAQKRGMRLFMAFLVSVALACFQSITFLVFPTDFCQDAECVMSRTAIFCAVSAGMYFFGGLCFLFMSNYPGEVLLAKEKMSLIQEGSTLPASSPSERSPAKGDNNLERSFRSARREQANTSEPEIEVVDSRANVDSVAVADEEVAIAAIQRNDPIVEPGARPKKRVTIAEIPQTDGKRADPPGK